MSPLSVRDERGSAVVELVTLGVLLLVPLVYLVLALGRVQAGAFAVSQAARESGRAFVTTDAGEDASARARAAAEISFADHRFDGEGVVDVACDGSPCLRPGGVVVTTASVRVALPLLPTFVEGAVPLSIPVSATHVSTVDRFRSTP
ncbi:pilus assembly protein [Phycicoccus sp. BSK3Z-2]|uniref:Pilus assembly protein n=1 Tax=Phycicoccus avicenniae TaxID=2828860 RepID=A0A941DA16_9MICO|nr:pilus assembly protein [Phycicoccus avicenniae]MBR7743868.1 pilus assembly protein [Phycicoccus avicenniae]